MIRIINGIEVVIPDGLSETELGIRCVALFAALAGAGLPEDERSSPVEERDDSSDE